MRLGLRFGGGRGGIVRERGQILRRPRDEWSHGRGLLVRLLPVQFGAVERQVPRQREVEHDARRVRLVGC